MHWTDIEKITNDFPVLIHWRKVCSTLIWSDRAPFLYLLTSFNDIAFATRHWALLFCCIYHFSHEKNCLLLDLLTPNICTPPLDREVHKLAFSFCQIYGKKNLILEGNPTNMKGNHKIKISVWLIRRKYFVLYRGFFCPRVNWNNSLMIWFLL